MTIGRDDIRAIIRERDKFIREYCEKKGWTANAVDMTFDQIMEIRNQPEWKNAGRK